MQPLSFRARLTLRWTVVFSCILAAASAAIDAGVRAASYEGLDRQLRTLAATEITSAIDGPTPFTHLHDLPETALAGGTFTEKLVQVYDAAGMLLIASPGRAQRTRHLRLRLSPHTRSAPGPPADHGGSDGSRKR